MINYIIALVSKALYLTYFLEKTTFLFLGKRKLYQKELDDYSRVIAPVVADLCTTPVALSAPPNSFQNNSQS